MTVTIFRGLSKSGTVVELGDALAASPSVRAPVHGKKPVRAMSLIFPGTLDGDSRAEPVTPVHLSHVVLDFDKLTAHDAQRVIKRLRSSGLGYTRHTTYSHDPDSDVHCFRVWLDTARTMTSEEHRRTARDLLREYPEADKTCAESTRSYFAPCVRSTDAPYRIAHRPGNTLVVVSGADLNDPGLIERRCPIDVSARDHAIKLARRSPAAIEGEGGQSVLLGLARALIWGLSLEPDEASAILREHFNPRCVPPWREGGADARDWEHKISDASQPFGDLEPGYLLPQRDVLQEARDHFIGTVPLDTTTKLFQRLSALESSGAPEIESIWADLKEQGYQHWQTLRNAVKKAAKQLSSKRDRGVPTVAVPHPEAEDMMLPSGYTIERGVLNFDSVKIMSGALIVLAKCPTLEGVYARIAFRSPSSPWQTSILPYRSLVDQGRVLALAEHGCNVTSHEAAAIVSYIGAYVATNEKQLDRPIATQTGWHDSGAFILGREVLDGPEGLKAEFPADNQIAASFIGAIGRHGKRKLEYTALREVVEELPVAATCLAAALAAPLVGKLGRSCVALHLGATGGSGKTRTIRIAGSVWGLTGSAGATDAGGVISSANTTARALEITAASRQHLPLLVSDLRPAPGLTEVLHGVINGAPRARATQTGGSSLGERFECGAVITEGELDLKALTTRQGFHRRIAEVTPDAGKPALAMLWRLAGVLSSNCGHLGRAFVVALAARDDLAERLAELDAESADLLPDRDVATRLNSLFLTVEIAADMLCVDADQWKTQIFRTLGVPYFEANGCEDQGDRAQEDIAEILTDLAPQIADCQGSTHVHDSARPWVGFRDGDDRIFIRSEILCEALRKRGHDATGSIVSTLITKGVIVASKEPGHLTSRKRFGGGARVRCYEVRIDGA